MTPTKLLIGQILIVFSIVIAGVRFATEWCAARLEPLSAALFPAEDGQSAQLVWKRRWRGAA